MYEGEEFWVALLNDSQYTFSAAEIEHVFEIDEGSDPGGKFVVCLRVDDIFFYRELGGFNDEFHPSFHTDGVVIREEMLREDVTVCGGDVICDDATCCRWYSKGP